MDHRLAFGGLSSQNWGKIFSSYLWSIIRHIWGLFGRYGRSMLSQTISSWTLKSNRLFFICWRNCSRRWNRFCQRRIHNHLLLMLAELQNQFLPLFVMLLKIFQQFFFFHTLYYLLVRKSCVALLGNHFLFAFNFNRMNFCLFTPWSRQNVFRTHRFSVKRILAQITLWSLCADSLRIISSFKALIRRL